MNPFLSHSSTCLYLSLFRSIIPFLSLSFELSLPSLSVFFLCIRSLPLLLFVLTLPCSSIYLRRSNCLSSFTFSSCSSRCLSSPSRQWSLYLYLYFLSVTLFISILPSLSLSLSILFLSRTLPGFCFFPHSSLLPLVSACLFLLSPLSPRCCIRHKVISSLRKSFPSPHFAAVTRRSVLHLPRFQLVGVV